MKYMVMECHKSYAVVLDEQGRFIKTANMNYQVGQSVSEIFEMRDDIAAKKKSFIKWSYSLAAAACLMLVSTALFSFGNATYASVYMSINPEVRIDVNRRDTVVGIDGVNADGDRLIDGYSFSRKPLNTVTDELVDKAIDMGYLSAGGQITIAFDSEDESWVAETGSTLTTHINEYLTDKLSVTIEIDGQSSGILVPVTPKATQTPAAAPTPTPAASPKTTAPAQSYTDDDYTAPAATPQVTPPAYTNDTPYTDGQTDYGTQLPAGQSNYSSSNYDEGASDYEYDDD